MTVPSVSLLCQLNSAAEHLEIHMDSLYCEDIFQTLQIQCARAGAPRFERYCCQVLHYVFQGTFRFMRSSCKRSYSTQISFRPLIQKNTPDYQPRRWQLESACRNLFQGPHSSSTKKLLAKLQMRRILPLLYFLSCSFPPTPYLKVSIYLIFRAALAESLTRSDVVTARSELQQVTFRKLSS